MARTMMIAYFSPLAPTRSSVSDYSEELLPHLCRRVHVDVYTDDRIAGAQEVGRIYPLYGYRDFARRERYDHLLFHLGNSPEHLPIYGQLLRSGGVVVLHDLELPALLGTRDATPGEGWGQQRLSRRDEGLGRLLRSAGDLFLRAQPLQTQGGRPSRLELGRVLEQRATGVVMHSGSAREHLAGRLPQLRLCQVPLGVRRPPVIDPGEARDLLGLPRAAFICLSVGRLGPEKRTSVALQAFARLLDRCPNSLYVLVGDPAPGYSPDQDAHALGIADRVRLPGHVDLATLYRYLAACDVGISLRNPGPAEASAGLLRIMSMGRPVVISECPAFADLPAECTLKVEPGAAEVAQISAALWALCGHRPMRQWYGERAARYVQANHSPAAAASRYVDFLEELASVKEAEQLLVREGTV